MALFGKLFSTAGLLLVASSSLGAQAAAKPACDVDASKGNLAKASFTLEQARTSQGTPGAGAVLTNAVKQIEAAKGENPTAQAFFLGQALAFWLGQPKMSYTPARGTLGFQQNPTATIDLVASIDSLFRVVETAKPACADLTAAYRGGLPGYLNIVNGAIAALNADQLDSAQILATMADRLYPGSPYGTMVLGSVASKRKDDAKALEYWAAAATSASKDSIYRDVQRQMLVNQGATFLARANGASGAARTDAARRAAELYAQTLAVPGTTGAYLASTRNNLQTAQLLQGDTAAFVKGYQPMLASPAAYGFQDLLNSAVNAARANRTADAAKLFEATLVQNPNSRDALYNLAVMYLTLEQNDKVGPIVQRLVAVDPANSDNYNLAARAYLARSKAAKAAKNAKLEAALNDTTMVWFTRGAKLPVEVTVHEFNAGEKQLIIAGNVTDRRDKVESNEPKPAPAKGKGKAKAPAAPAFAPAAVTVKIEALDKAGAVIGTQTVTTEPLTPGKVAPFRVTIDAPEAAAYRYTVGG